MDKGPSIYVDHLVSRRILFGLDGTADGRKALALVELAERHFSDVSAPNTSEMARACAAACHLLALPEWIQDSCMSTPGC